MSLMGRISKAMQRNSDLISTTEASGVNFNTTAATELPKRLFATETTQPWQGPSHHLSALVRTMKNLRHRSENSQHKNSPR